MRRVAIPLLTFAVVSLTASGCLDRELRPIVPCVSQGFVQSIMQNGVDKVDLLFEVDDSPSMVMGQAHLAAQIPHLVTALTTGDLNGDGVQDFPPVTDLHAGVITVNMGVGGIPNVPTCMAHADFGDDGILINTARVGGAGCMASYPRFLAFDPAMTPGYTPTMFATDFTCVARTGVGGCGFEQQLDSSLKAVLPSTSPVTFYAATHGHGDDPATNGGFLRSDSLIVILDITDEDDCSTDQTDIWNPASATHTGDLNLRCINYFDELYPVQRFIDGFKSLRTNPNLVIFATITGVPQDLVALPTPDSTIDYDRLLADPRMQNVIVTTGGTQALQHSCEDTSGDGYYSVPGIRMTQVAKAFGANGVVQSICQDDWGPLLDVVIQKIANQLGHVCLPRKLNPDSTGKVGCSVVELINPTMNPSGPATCADVPGAESTYCAANPMDPECSDPNINPTTPETDALNYIHCNVHQVPIDPATRASGAMPVESTKGWYYDDFTMDTLTKCNASQPQRIAFFDDSNPLSGTIVNLECLQRVQGTGSGEATPTGLASIGSPCTPGLSDNGALGCNMGNAAGLPLACETNARVCQVPCLSDADCNAPSPMGAGLPSFACFSPTGDMSTGVALAGACPAGMSNPAYPASPSCWCVNPICI